MRYAGLAHSNPVSRAVVVSSSLVLLATDRSYLRGHGEHGRISVCSTRRGGDMRLG